MMEPQMQNNEPAPKTLTHIVLLVAVSAALFLFRAGSLPLTDPDESRCALIAVEMIKSGDWLVPHLVGVAYFDKPAPFFWLAAAAFKLTGNIELSGRLIAALAGIAAVLTTYALARRIFDATAGLFAGLVLATSAEFLFIARWFRMDMPFTAAMWAAVWWFWRAESLFAADNNPAHRKKGWLGFYFFCAIATLFKGPAGLLLPGLIVIAYLLLSRQYRRLTGFFYLPAVALYLLIAAPWFIAISLSQPDYAYSFFIYQNIERYSGHSFKRNIPGIIYVLILLAGLMPWTVYLPAAIGKYFPRRWQNRAQQPHLLMLWLAAVVTVTFFALGKTKLPSYILLAFPPLAVLIGAVIADWCRSGRPDKKMTNAAKTLILIVLLVLSLLVALEIFLGCIDLWFVIPAAFTIFALWRMIIALWRSRHLRFITWAFSAFLVILLFIVGHTAKTIYEPMSFRSLARLVPPDLVADSKFCFLPRHGHSFILYAGVPKTEKLGKVSLEGVEKAAELLAGSDRVFCVVNGRKFFDKLNKTVTSPLYIVGRSADHWLLTNKPLPNTETLSPQP